MSKERLEQIKRSAFKNRNYDITKLMHGDVVWLIEQAEQVEKLNERLSKNGIKYNGRINTLKRKLNRMTRQRNKYRDEAILLQMEINLENHKKEIRERSLEGYKNLSNKYREALGGSE